MDFFRKEIVNTLRKEVGGKGKLSTKKIAELLEVPTGSDHGDFAFPCFSLAKTKRQPPNVIANELAEKLEVSDSLESIKAVGGYVNFTIKPEKLSETILRQIYKERDAYGASNHGKSKRLVIEYSSPNIAKPFGIGHLRSTNIGNALARIFRFLNYDVISCNHLGDWGTQFGKIITAYKQWGNADFLKGDPIINLYKLYVRFHDEEKDHPELNDEAREWFAKLENGDVEATELWEWFRDLSLKELKDIYSLLDIHFDYQLGESFYTDKMPAIVESLQEKKLLESSEGAEIVRFDEIDNMPPALIKKKDGSTLYITRDLAAAEYRHKTYQFDEMLYVVGTPQALHFQQLFKVLEKLGNDWAKNCEHIGFGHLSFKDKDGETSMSTRSGSIIFLKDVLERAKTLAGEVIAEKNPDLENKEEISQKVGIAAVIYADFSARRRKDVKFSWDEILNFDGETGPYLQYASVRMRSLLEKYTGTITDSVDFDQLSHPEEKALIKTLAQFSETLVATANEREPFIFAQYLTQIAKHFNKFYNRHRVLDQDGETSLARVLLTHCTSSVFDLGLKLLGIPVPEKM